MSIRNLQQLFEPASVAIIGASAREHSVGATVLRNMIAAGFAGKIYPVNPKYDELEGLRVWHDVARLPEAPDLAVICTPPATVPGIIRALGALGTKAAVVLTAGLGGRGDAAGRQDRTLRQRMLDEARPHLLRILGPNCVGLLTPAIGLNASFAHTGAEPGRIAFVSQSGALVTGVLDWAKSRGIGFSRFISLGDSADVDFGDVLDYLAGDMRTQAILLYMEDVRAARKFMSAARAAARSKPVLVLKSGRAPEGAKAAASHTGALAGSDNIYDAAIRRAGMLRVDTTEDLFGAVETLARARPLRGDRLAILTNGGGPGVMATDALVLGGGKMAALSDETIARLDAVLPGNWSRGNPVDIIGDAPVERYVKAADILVQDPQADAVLLIHAPTAIVPSAEIAHAITPMAKTVRRNLLTCWLGGDAVAEARRVCAGAGIPTYDTPEEAVRAFLYLVNYRINQNLLIQAPPTLPADCMPDRAHARVTLRAALAQGRDVLSEPEAKEVLAAYGIPVVATRAVDDTDAAARAAQEIGFPVALKILSPDITHKSDVGGVVLDLETADAVRTAATAMKKRMHEFRPQARVQGFSVQTMARRPQSHELIVGIATDPVFGPVVLFGQGGVAVEVTADHAVALPPLNMVLARDLVSRTRVVRLLEGYRNLPPADLDAICRVLIQVSHLATEIPEIVELDINPLLADAQGVIALDARIRIAAVPEGAGGANAGDRLAIRPYPQELEETITWKDGPLHLRPIRPEDSEEHVRFFQSLNPDDVRLRAFILVKELQPEQLARLTQIDYDREIAFIATRPRDDGSSETLGVVRGVCDPDNVSAEFAVTVRSDLKGRGLGSILMRKLIDYCRRRGTKEIVGEALLENTPLIEMVKRLGFEVKPVRSEGIVKLRLDLTRQPVEQPAVSA